MQQPSWPKRITEGGGWVDSLIHPASYPSTLQGQLACLISVCMDINSLAAGLSGMASIYCRHVRSLETDVGDSRLSPDLARLTHNNRDTSEL